MVFQVKDLEDGEEYVVKVFTFEESKSYEDEVVA
jgi:hypothetical protein